jgi:hypothetical protein
MLCCWDAGMLGCWELDPAHRVIIRPWLAMKVALGVLSPVSHAA